MAGGHERQTAPFVCGRATARRHDRFQTTGSRGNFAWGDFSADGKTFVVTASDSIRVHSLPEAARSDAFPASFRWGLVRGQSLFTGAFVEPTSDGRARRLVGQFPLPAAAPETSLGVWTSPPGAMGPFAIDPGGEAMFSIHGGSLFELPLRELARTQPRMVVRGDDPVQWFALSHDGARIHAWHKSRRWRIWSRSTGAPLQERHTPDLGEQIFDAAVSADGRWLGLAHGIESVSLWDLEGPPAHEAIAAAGRPADPRGVPSERFLAGRARQSARFRSGR